MSDALARLIIGGLVVSNPNTRISYGRAVREFCEWCESRRVRLAALNPVIVAGYVELLGLPVEEHGRGYSKPTVKQHLAAIRMLLDYLVTGGILPANPASSVRGPKYSIKRGKTPVLTAEEARQLLAAIETDTIIGLRDRALIAVMIYSLARISAAVSMRVEDYFQAGKRWKLRFMERGGKFNEVFAHRTASAGARGSGIRKIPIGIDRQAGLTGSRTLSYKSMGTLKEYDPEPHL